MKKIILTLILFTLVFSQAAFAEKILNVDPTRYLERPGFLGYVSDRFIVVLKEDVAVNHAKDMQANLALTDISGFKELAGKFKVTRLRPQFPGSDRGQMAQSSTGRALARHYKVYFNSGTIEEAMAAYEALPHVDHVEPIGIHTLYAIPNDPYYDDPPPNFPYDQWHYWDTYGINADMAWDLESGAQTVIVGDLDIGIKYDHGDLGGSNPPGPSDASTNGNIWVNTGEIPGNGIDDDGNGYIDDVVGWDFVERTDWYPSYPCIDLDCGGADNDPWDGDGHGTHTCGTIAAITNNSYAVAGVAGGYGDGTIAGGGNGVKVVPCRIGYVLDYWIYGPTGVVIMDYVAEAMYYMAELKTAGWNVAAINCSFGSSNSGGLAGAADYLISQDVVIVVAAGNSNSSSPDYLGSRGDCLDVGATNQNGNPASFSNYGSWVDIAAPGVDVMSTSTDPDDPTGDYVAPLDGTSMACPHVVGVVALLESYNPLLSATDKFDIITNPANTNPYNQSKDVGVGIVDARKCLDAAQICDLIADFSSDPASGCAPLTVGFTDSSTGTGIDGWSWDFGDDGTSTEQNPSYTYNTPGTYTVSLTVSNSSQGCENTRTKTDYINIEGLPTANFEGSPTSGTEPLTVDFTDFSTNATGWSWNFGDGIGTSDLQNPSYTYNDAGTYTVTLMVTNNCGSDTATMTDYITVTEPQCSRAYAESDIPVIGTVTNDFTYTHVSDDSYEVITEELYTGHPRKTYSYLEHKWDFTIADGSDVTFYLEAYRPDNDDGDDFTFAYSTDDVTYIDLLTVASSTEQVYTASIPAVDGTVYIRVVDTNRSWSNSSLDPIYIDEMYFEYSCPPAPLAANFSGSPASGVAPLTVDFTDLSTGVPDSWDWTFGDGGTSNDQNPSHTYTVAGTYTVSLTVANAQGTDTETKIGYITVTEPGQDKSHVENMAVGRRKVGANYRGTCTVTIHDQNNAPLANATVYVAYDGPNSGSLNGTTGSDGTVYFESAPFKKPTGEWCFEITNVTHETHNYDAGSNEVTMACESGLVYGNK